jgi:hypothetical protein
MHQENSDDKEKEINDGNEEKYNINTSDWPYWLAGIKNT